LGDQRYAKFVWGIPTTIKDAKAKDIEVLELCFKRKQR
jgi:SecD/SecF fusion protein